MRLLAYAIETEGEIQGDSSDELVFDFGEGNSCAWVKLDFASVLESSMFPARSDDQTFLKPHIEVTA